MPPSCLYQLLSAGIFSGYIRWIPSPFKPHIAGRATKSIVFNVVLTISPSRDDMIVLH